MPNQQQLSLADESDEYKAFVDKFKPKKTTDDCYTPPEIYAVILLWVVERYGIDHTKVVRPFWPGADYQSAEYPDGCTVVDNPPFSMLASICRWYLHHGVPFFLFAPTMTILHAAGTENVTKVNHIVCSGRITYENGASVPTSFVTNLDVDGTVLESAPDLAEAITAKDKELQKATKKHVPKYAYPDHIITAAKVNYFCSHHTPYRLSAADCAHIAKIDAMGGKTIFGGGLILSERAAAERAAAERAAAERAAAIKWELSPRELAIVKLLDGQSAKSRQQSYQDKGANDGTRHDQSARRAAKASKAEHTGRP